MVKPLERNETMPHSLIHRPVNRKALQLYHCLHLFIPSDGDEEDVRVYSHSQGDWEELKHQKGWLWTIPTEILEGRISHYGGYAIIDNPPQTPYDLWQWATRYGYMPTEL